jgi:hypothetical protein
MDAI